MKAIDARRAPRTLRALAFCAAAALALTAAAAGTLDAKHIARLHRASMLLAAQKYTEAVAELSVAVAVRDIDTQSLRLLTRAHMSAAQYERAWPLVMELLARQPDSPRELYAAGLIQARRSNRDDAFAWFGKAAATGKFDLTALQGEAGLEAIRADARYAALLPNAQSFAHPFVEDVTILREWDGESANDQFGWIARGIGDVDGDGAADFVTSAPTKDIHGAQAGRVYVYSSRSGKLLWSADGAPGDQLGSGLESAGDVDGDGVQDVVASAPGHEQTYVYSGRDGHVLLTLHGEAAGDNFGNGVASAGDFDRDGHADVIIGAPGNNANGAGAGRAYVYSGKDGHVLRVLSGEKAGDAFGSAVAGYADATRSLLVIGAPGAGERATGRVYVYEGASDQPKFTIDADETGRQLGYMFVAVLGDVDGDGVPDIFASDWSNDAAGPSTGRIYVYSGKTGKRLRVLTGAEAGESFGTTHSVAGDVDGDGRADLIVGSWQYSAAAVGGGRARLYSGRSGALLKTYTSRVPGETFGFDAVSLGDVDADGSADFLITSGWSSVRGYRSGRVFLISSGVRKQ